MTISPYAPTYQPIDPTSLQFASPSPASPLNVQVQPQLSNPASLAEQINGALQTATQPYIPLSIPGVGSPDTQSPIIPNLPNAIHSFQTKYTRDLPTLQQAVASGAIPAHAVNSLAAFDLRRVQRGQSPLGTDASARALQTIASGQAATPEPHHSAWDIFGNVGRDLKAIVASIPRIPSALYKEATHLGDIPSDIANAPNPITGVLQAHGIRLIPGAYTIGNLAEGGKGISELVHHPLMTGLDVFAGDALLGKAAGVEGGLARSAIAESEVGQKLSGFRQAMTDGLRATRGGQWATAMFGERARALSILTNGMASQVHIGLSPHMEINPTLIDPEGVATSLARGATTLAKKWSEQISPSRMVELTDHMQIDPSAIADIPDHERAFLNEARDITDSITAYHVGNGDLQQLVTNGQMEVFEPAAAATIRKAWRRRDIYENFTAIRQTLRNPELTTPDDLAALVPRVVNFLGDDRFSANAKIQLGRGYAYAVRGMEGTLPEGFLRTLTQRDFDTASNLLESHVPTFDAPLTRRDIALRSKWENQTTRYTPGRSARAAKESAEIETETLPARWREWRDQLVQQKITSKLAAYGDANHVDVSALVEQSLNRDYNRIAQAGLLTDGDIRTFSREAAATIAEMKRVGKVDPIFVHRVDAAQPNSINYPQPARGTLSGTVAVPSQLKAIKDLPAPYVHDVTVALAHEGQQILNSAAQRAIYSELLRTTPLEGETVAPFARTAADLDQIYDGVARNRQSFNPSLDVRAIVKRRMEREWVKFPIDKLPADLKVQLGLTSDDLGASHPYIPRSVYQNLKVIANPPEIGVIDPILHVFRTSLLALSPRFLLYHMLGGAVQLMGQTDPFTVWKYLGQAREMVTENRLPQSLRPTLGHVIDPTLEWSFRNGNTLRRLVGENSPLTQTAEKVGEGFQNLTTKSYSVVSFFNDTYRAMSYLYGYDKALTKGLTVEQATAAGEALARKTLLTWDNMTAMERTAMRYVFPFYGFAKHMLNYAAKYPLDHPFRTAVVSTIARNELADLGTGLPMTMLNMLFLGHPDSHGHVRAINTAALNPFRDVSSMTTLAGWLSATNPIISGVLASAGLDVSSGGPDLYPNLHYDTETGRLAPTSTNPLLNIAYQTLPQSQILGGLLSKSSEYKDLMRLDPAAAMRLIASQGGIPVSFRDLNVDRTIIQDELTRQTAQSTAFSDALKTGDWSQARQWPALNVTLNTVQALQQSGALSQFQPGGANNVNKLQQIQQMIASVG